MAAALFALYALEAVFAFASPAWIDKLGTTLRKGPNVVAETIRMRHKGLAAYPYLQPDTFTDSSVVRLQIGGDSAVAPLAGIAGALTVLCNESGTTIGYRSDSLGFRNPNSVWGPVQPDVALVGDSFAHGFCRPDPETIASRLRGARVATVNAGLTGAGPLAELGVVREYLGAVRPRVVFWLFYEGNDLIDITSERRTILARYLDTAFTQNLRQRNTDVSDAMKVFADSAIRAHPVPGIPQRVWGFVSLRRLRTATGLYRHPTLPAERDERAELSVLGSVLDQANREITGWGGELRLVYLPERRRFDRATAAVVGENHDPRAVERSVRDIASRRGIPVIDVAAAFASEPDPRRLWNARRYHYNAAGYSIVARAILSDLERHPLAARAGVRSSR